ncbi:MAG: GxxExxY protein [Verrucomicrobiae bacterium]|nr:GxxExxY protein [Verrucomicrobiae bacterium]
MQPAKLEQIEAAIVDSSIKVHRELGPGLLENAYEFCLSRELRKRSFFVECQKSLPITYDGATLDIGYRLDLIVEGSVIIEAKAVEQLLPVHRAQIITYLKLSGCTLGYLINFNMPLLKDGLKRIVLEHPHP